MNRLLASIGLRFADPQLEDAFRRSFASNVLTLQRLLLALAIAIFLAYALRDVSLSPISGYAPLYFRMFFLLPVLAIGFALSYSETAKPHFPGIVAGVVVITTVGLGIISLLYPQDAQHDPGSAARTMSTIILMICTMLMAGLRFEHAVGVGLMAILFWILGSIAKQLPVEGFLLMGVNVAMSFAVLTAVAYWLERAMRRAFVAEKSLADERAQAQARQFALLPPRAAQRFARGDKPIADAYLEAFFVAGNLVGFNDLTKRMGPKETVRVLDRLFSAFDDIALEHGLDRLNIVGDRCVLAGGASDDQTNDPASAIRAALAMLDEVRRAAEDHNVPLGMRVGVHLGPIIGGVTGRNPPTYDYWGDTLDIANRLEATGEPGRIHCSEVVQWRLGKEFAFERMPPIEVRGIGTIQTYSVKATAAPP